MIEIKGLNYTYDDGRLALEQVNLHISKGEKVALVGPNGAGKTTLLLHLNGILRGNGSIFIGKMELDDHSLRDIRAKAGLVFQSPDNQLFSSSVYADVAYGLIYQGVSRKETRERVASALAEVGMAGSEQRSPYHLSLGEKKRVALAAVLVMRPEVLVLDEPSAGLDPRGRREVINLLTAMPQTMLVATHDLALAAEICPRLMVMDAGKLVFDGQTNQGLADKKLLSAHGLVG